MTTVELLREARALIDTPEKWTQGAFARDGKGDRVDELDKRACRFCASGATSRVTGIKSPAITPAYKAIQRAMGVGVFEVSVFNDQHTHAEVLAAFDKAIAAEEAKA
jgi:hypothetical protein